MVARSYASSNQYRYGFNGKEHDSDGLGGGGSTYDYGFRIYNPNIAKFLSVDPLSPKYPWYTPYQFAGNKPIQCIDRDGLEEIEVHSATITGEIEALKLKGYTEGEIRWVVYEKMNIHTYDAPGGAKYAGKHFGYAQNGKIVEVTNPTKPLIIWGYRPINSVNEKGEKYISGYERYKVYDATKPIEKPKATAPAKVVPKSSSSNGILDDIADLGSNIDNYMRHAGPNLEGQYGYDHGGKQLLGGTVAVVSAPVAIVGGGIGAAVGWVSLANGLDDMGTNTNGESLTQQLATNHQDVQTVLGYTKAALTVGTGAYGVSQIATKGVSGFANAANLVGTVNDANSTAATVVSEVKKAQQK